MNKNLEEVILSLDKLSTAVDNIISNKTVLLTNDYSWDQPSLTINDVADLANHLCDKLKQYDHDKIEEYIEADLITIPKKIDTFIARTLPNIMNGGMYSYIILIQWIDYVTQPLFSWETLNESKALPKGIINRLRSIQADLDNIIPDKTELEKQVNTIKEATETAESLPVDLGRLKEARVKVEKYSDESTAIFGKLESTFNAIEKISKVIETRKEEADKLVAQCEEAYRITTTKGLSSAFDLRAERLRSSITAWLWALILSLITGVGIGWIRFNSLHEEMLKNIEPNYIWIQIFLSALSLGAPIWLAWVSTKQISQRFKLSEDYAFKASVAKAYEGYKKEAARIDESFEKRLFDSALSRLEEAPIRLMEKDSHGSPWEELMNNPTFKKLIDEFPDLKENIGLLRTTYVQNEKSPK